MKKLLLLSALLIFACSSDDSTSDDSPSDDNNNELLNCDGNPVPTIVYGTQEWTVENTCHITYRDGTPIPEVTDAVQWQNITTGAWCYYDNDVTKGKLYNWYAVAGIHDNDDSTANKEFEPEGWHVPSVDEWTTIEEYLIANGYNYDGTTMENKIAKSMASTSGWNIGTNTGVPGNDQSLNNSSGFNAFPEGHRLGNGSFLNEGYYAYFWSSTGRDTSDAWNRNLGNLYSSMSSNIYFKQGGFSVRLVRD